MVCKPECECSVAGNTIRCHDCGDYKVDMGQLTTLETQPDLSFIFQHRNPV